MGYSMRLEFTLVSSINDLWLVRLIYIYGSLFLFPGVCLLWTALPFFDIWYAYSCVRVCMCVIYIYIYIYIYNQDIGPAVRVLFANGPGDLGSIPGRVIPKTFKMELDTTLLNTQHYRYGSRVKWRNPGNGVAPSPTPWCSSYRKGSLRYCR